MCVCGYDRDGTKFDVVGKEDNLRHKGACRNKR
jgi:hypothetical protein